MDVQKARILIVEDEALVAEDLRMRLLRMGYAVTGIVDRAEDVLTATLESSPDIVLMDIKLKGASDGIEAGRRLRSLHQVPFVFVTSYADRATLDRACRAEPFGYVVKPFDERAIQAAIEMALSRHRAEQQLRTTEKWMRTILRTIGDAVVVTDREQRITFMNQSGELLSRWPAGAALGEPFDHVFRLVRADDGAPVPSPDTAAIRTRGTVTLADGTELVARDGVRIPVDATATPILEGSDDVAGAVVVLRDCSERAAAAKVRRKAEQDLQEARRLESLGRLAGGLAHDFNNMLTAVLGNAELLGRELPEGGEHGQLVRAIEASARAAARICQRLRDYAALQRPLREPIDLRALVDDTLGLVRVLLGKGTVVRVDMPATLPVLLGDRVQLQQVLMNLLMNAAESSGERAGQIAVRAGVAEVPPTVTSIPASLPAGSYVFVEVRDDGLGMTREVQERIFDPFFSTKQGGRGLGLPGVLGIVRSHRGGLRVHSAPGQGATFRILLPLAPEPLPGEGEPTAAASPPAAPAGRELLIVDVDD